ncbi:response regulator [Nocardioides sp. CN2-186]|uniref:response regulator n=1 Tax=Nocardioides tweenelious TaxID=3156607 RepID=UPI0032B4154D
MEELIDRPVALVIEDDPDIADLLEVVLSQVGFAVMHAVNGVEGIALAQEHKPVLATIDIGMPKMDGLEATRRIREFSDAYIVIISTRSEERDILAGFDAGADDYVPKPIRPLELRARLAAAARRPLADSAIELAWAPADADLVRSEHLRRIAAGESFEPPAEQDDADAGQEGRDGMLEIGMRFVGGWIEFRGLRINPSRGIVVVDDRLADLPQEHIDLLEILMYIGSRTLTARQLALRLRGQTEQTATTTHRQDERWIDSLMTGLRLGLRDDEPEARWIEALPRDRYRLVQPALVES